MNDPRNCDPRGRDASVRRIRRRDNPVLRQIIADVLGQEFGEEGHELKQMIPEYKDMHGYYDKPRAAYFVVELARKVVGGAGIAPLTNGPPNVCELQKMYFAAFGRGKGLARLVLNRCLEHARELGYSTCYLETREDMTAARRLYEAAGFRQLDEPLVQSEYHTCDVYYALSLELAGTASR